MDHITRHLMGLYGMDPVTSMALQFPRLPPGVGDQQLMPRPQGIQEIVPQAKLDDYTRMLQRHAAGLLTMANPGIIPPGHPLYNRQNSVETLQAENSKLQRENLELKKQLESTPRGKRML